MKTLTSFQSFKKREEKLLTSNKSRHGAKFYSPIIQESIVKALRHPQCVGLGEIGLDYHYNHSPRNVQQRVLITQLKLAIEHNKPLTIHTREADVDIERILKENVPREHKVNTIYCLLASTT